MWVNRGPSKLIFDVINSLARISGVSFGECSKGSKWLIVVGREVGVGVKDKVISTASEEDLNFLRGGIEAFAVCLRERVTWAVELYAFNVGFGLVFPGINPMLAAARAC